MRATGPGSADQAGRIAHAAERAGLRLVRFMWCGNDGTVRAKASAASGLEHRIVSGIGLTVAMQAMNSLDQLQPVEGMGPVGEIRLVPDPETFTLLPFVPATGAMVVDMFDLDGRPAGECPRSFLRRMQERLRARGGVLHAAFENEFTLATDSDDGPQPVDRSLCFSTIGLNASAHYTDELLAALEQMDIVVEQHYAELGHGQQELSTAPAPALRAADQQVYVREAIRGVATSMGYVASLAPKPWPEAAGNGCHIHFSLWDGSGGNRFYDPGASDGLSSEARAFVAGVLEHLPALAALTAPSYNSYRRLVPSYWAGAYTCWGYDNREAPLRIPSRSAGREEATTNVELKTADATCNPYIALGGLIAAGLDGLERGLEPPPPVEVDPATLEDAQREAWGVRRLPETQRDALDALESDEVLMEAMGDRLRRSYLAVRRSEWEAYSSEDEAFEQRGHFFKY